MPQVETGQSTVLEPKYCEGCGALGLRPKDAPIAYCDRCQRRREEFAAVRQRLVDRRVRP